MLRSPTRENNMFPVRLLLPIILLTLWPTSGLAAQAWQLHVSPAGDDRNDGSATGPLRSLGAAQERVRARIERGRTGPIEVLIAGGVWSLDKPLVFDHRDASSQTPVTYRAAAGQQVILSGGRAPGEWRREGGFWVATLSEECASLTPRLLILDGRPAPRAREPDEGFFRVVRAGPDRRTAFQFEPQGFTAPEQPAGTELVFLHDWSITRVGLKEVNAADRQLVLAHPIGGDHEFFAIDGFEAHARYRLENDRAFADTPGEWYFDPRTRTLGVRAKGAADPPPVALLPLLSTLVRMEGTAGQPLRGLTLADLEFGHTACTLPAAGAAEVQAGFFQPRGQVSEAEDWLNRLAPAVELAFAEDCAIRDCRFGQLGGGGVYLHRQSHRNQVTGSRFSEIGGCAVMIGDPHPPRTEQGERLVCRNNRLENSDLARCGQLLHGSVGVWVGITSATVVRDNEIHSLPYTGVSVGWQWDPEPTGCENNLVAGNHIHHVMQLLSDGGGIYTLGRQPGTVLRDNRIHDVPLNAGRAESNGIFMDEGSSLIEVTGNEIFATARSPIRFHKAQELKVQGNRLRLAPGLSPFTYNATDPAQIVTEPNELIQEPPK
jgi:hypothetical protein